MKKIVVINGPNLNLLGEREPEIYGTASLDDIKKEVENHAAKVDCKISFYQSNNESEIIDLIQKHRQNITGIIINPAGFSHTSVAILDALLACEVPIIEVHLSNLYKREKFRQTSLTAAAADGIISGLGKEGYLLAVDCLVNKSEGQ